MFNGHCYHGYASSLLENVLDLKENNIQVYWYFIANESLITRGRNYIVDYFLKSTCTHLMFIDADISFPRTAIRSLLETKEDFVCAPYPKKFIDWNRVNFLANNRYGNYIQDLRTVGASYVINYMDNNLVPSDDSRGLVEVRHAGTGFMLIHRNVFDKLGPTLPKARAANFGANAGWYTEYFKTDIDEEGVLQSEDWFFCNKWKDVGGKIYLMRNLKLNHIGTYVFEGDIVNAGANVS